jgi:hypothetical protein
MICLKHLLPSHHHFKIKAMISALELFKKEETALAINELSAAEYTCWNDDLIEKYKDQIDWDLLSCNMNLPWSKELIMRYEDRWEWRALSYVIANVLEEMDFRQIVFIYKDRISWSIICQGINITEEIVRDYRTYIDWQALSEISLFNWSWDFVNYHRKRIDWDVASGTISAVSLQKNKTYIPNYISHFVNYWNWNELSQNTQLYFNTEILKTNRKHWNWELLINNESVVWNYELLEEFDTELSTVPEETLKESYLWKCMHKIAGDRFRNKDLGFMLALF